jgi:hypothetical protein
LHGCVVGFVVTLAGVVVTLVGLEATTVVVVVDATDIVVVLSKTVVSVVAVVELVSADNVVDVVTLVACARSSTWGAPTPPEIAHADPPDTTAATTTDTASLIARCVRTIARSFAQLLGPRDDVNVAAFREVTGHVDASRTPPASTAYPNNAPRAFTALTTRRARWTSSPFVRCHTRSLTGEG